MHFFQRLRFSWKGEWSISRPRDAIDYSVPTSALPILDTAGILFYSWFAVVGPGAVVAIASAPSYPSWRLSEILTWLADSKPLRFTWWFQCRTLRIEPDVLAIPVLHVLILRTTKKCKVSHVGATTTYTGPTFRLRYLLLVSRDLHLVGSFMDLKRQDWCALKNFAREPAQQYCKGCSALYFRTELPAFLV